MEAIRQIAHRYNQQGKEGLVDRHHQHPGPKGFLSDERQAQLEMALQERALDGGLWNGRKVGDWLTELIDHTPYYQSKYLLKFSHLYVLHFVVRNVGSTEKLVLFPDLKLLKHSCVNAFIFNQQTLIILFKVQLYFFCYNLNIRFIIYGNVGATNCVNLDP